MEIVQIVEIAFSIDRYRQRRNFLSRLLVIDIASLAVVPFERTFVNLAYLDKGVKIIGRCAEEIQNEDGVVT